MLMSPTYCDVPRPMLVQAASQLLLGGAPQHTAHWPTWQM